MLRPGLVTAIAGNIRDRFVVFGGLAEFSQDDLTILAESATSVEDLDLAALEAEIAEMQEGLAKQSPGAELDREIARLDHYKSIRISLAPATAF
jgi:F-type H+-transporting ATPase subunit epsilon